MGSDASIEIARRLADLLRENARLQAEVHSLAAILRSAVLHREIPKGWSADLKRMRSTPEYRTVAEQHADVISRLERSASSHEVRQILVQGSQTRPVN
jgi:hypothetical protein